jgi:hypothetical protein
MRRSITTLAIGLGLAASLPPARPAAADEIVPTQGGGFGPVQVVFVDPLTGNGVQLWSAKATDAFFGPHTISGFTVFDLENGTASGWFHAVSADGVTKVSGSFEGEFTEIPKTNDSTLNLTVRWKAGTGLLAGVSGKAATLGSQTVDPQSGLGTHEYEYVGVYRLPSPDLSKE